MTIYTAPKKRVHRGFVYLDDATVINSLSAMESGKIDEVVAKIAQARDGGVSGGVNAGVGGVGGKLEGGKKASSSFEEEVVRTRTRFSIFELWYQQLMQDTALGKFDGWDETALDGVAPGDTIEITGSLQIVPLQTVLRLYRWFAGQAQDQSSLFAQKGEELKATKNGLRALEALLGGTDEVLAMLRPDGGDGPTVGIILDNNWLISGLGRLDGIYTVVAQVEMVLGEDDKWPTVRLTNDAPVTKMERDTLTQVVANFKEPAAGLGVIIEDNASELRGPALLLRAIAAYR